jgi:hypothetical protein
MDQLRNAAQEFLAMLRSLLDVLLSVIGVVEVWLERQLLGLGVSQQITQIILIAAAILLILAALRVLGGLLRVVVLIFLILLAYQFLQPLLHG